MLQVASEDRRRAELRPQEVGGGLRVVFSLDFRHVFVQRLVFGPCLFEFVVQVNAQKIVGSVFSLLGQHVFVHDQLELDEFLEVLQTGGLHDDFDIGVHRVVFLVLFGQKPVLNLKDLEVFGFLEQFQRLEQLFDLFERRRAPQQVLHFEHD